MDISLNKLGLDIGVSPRRINEIVHGKRAVTADTNLRLSRALGTSKGCLYPQVAEGVLKVLGIETQPSSNNNPPQQMMQTILALQGFTMNPSQAKNLLLPIKDQGAAC